MLYPKLINYVLLAGELCNTKPLKACEETGFVSLSMSIENVQNNLVIA